MVQNAPQTIGLLRSLLLSIEVDQSYRRGTVGATHPISAESHMGGL